jgi:hypothetical protein
VPYETAARSRNTKAGRRPEAGMERKAGPVGKVRKIFEEVSQLPRQQQEKIVEFVSVFLRQYQQRKQN